jgi:hypothetical protein
MIGLPFFDSGCCRLLFKGPSDEKDLEIRIQSSGDKAIVETAASIWHAGISLAAMLIESPELVQGRSVLELGAGCGLVSIVAAALGARRVVITDLECARRNIEQNIEQNSHLWSSGKTPCDIEFQPLDWLASQIDMHECIDIVVGADIGFDISLHDPINRVLSAVNPSVGVLLCEEVRWKDIFSWYKEALLISYPRMRQLRLKIVSSEEVAKDDHAAKTMMVSGVSCQNIGFEEEDIVIRDIIALTCV